MVPDLFLFTVDPTLARVALNAGISAFVVDWEDRTADLARSACIGSDAPDSPADLALLAGFAEVRRVCRVNPMGGNSRHEIDLAIATGATHILLPMVETAYEVDRLLAIVADRAKAGIMIETTVACDNATELSRMPLDFVYVGLLDLAISKGEGNVFRPLADGTAMYLRDLFHQTQFGIGGLTVVDRGHPVPCLALMGELSRLRCDFTFVRRSFKRDIVGRDMTHECRRIERAWQRLLARSQSETAADHRIFVERYGASAARQ